MNYTRHARPDGARIAFYLLCLVILPILALIAACSPADAPSLPTTPTVIADTTVIDEKAMIAAEQSYLAVGAAIEAATKAGLLTGQTATRVDRLDEIATDAMMAMRAAYDTGNAESFGQALARARATLDQVKALLSGVNRSDPNVKVQ